MLELLSNEEFLKPVLGILALIAMLTMLKKVNKVLLIVGIGVLAALYFLNEKPEYAERIWSLFQVV